MTGSQEDLEDRLRRVLDQAAAELRISPATWYGPRPGSRRRRLPLPGVSSILALAGVAVAVAVLVAVAALASLHGPPAGPQHQAGAPPSNTGTKDSRTSPTSSTSQPRSTTNAGVTAGSVERAILRQKNPPGLTAASCRAPAASERARATIGGADSVCFSCKITLAGSLLGFTFRSCQTGPLSQNGSAAAKSRYSDAASLDRRAEPSC